MNSLLRDLRDAIRGSEQDYTKLRLSRAIFLLAIPMVLEMLFESTFAILDIFFVSRINNEIITGDMAASIVGFTESVMTMIYAIGMGVAMGTTALVSRRIGEKHDQDAAIGAGQAILLGIMLSFLIAIPGILFPGKILELLNAEPKIVAHGKTYTSLMLGSNVLIMLLFINNAIFRSAGNPVLSMRVLILANLINMVLDPILIFGWGPFPEMGVTGAAVATITGRSIAVAYQFYLMAKGEGKIKLIWQYFIIRPKIIQKVLFLSGGGMLQFIIATTSWIFLYSILGEYKHEVTAGYTYAIRLFIFFLLPAWGLSNAVSTLVGQNLGANNPARAERAVYYTGLANVGYMFVIMLLFLFIPHHLVNIFKTSPRSFEVAVDCLRIISIGNIFYGFQMVLGQAFNGAGDTYTPTWLNFIAFWLIEIPLAWTLANVAGMEEKGVFWSVFIAETILCLISFYIFTRGRWKKMLV
ncbi:MAG: MATE family efflux transporter [Bacteroidota bacterium]|nr:MAG: MATE family efflux transporter [Bacteroidota bacterium]